MRKKRLCLLSPFVIFALLCGDAEKQDLQNKIIHLNPKDFSHSSSSSEQENSLKSDIDLAQDMDSLMDEDSFVAHRATGSGAEDEDATIDMNFDNVSLASVVKILGERKNINLILHKDLLATKVSLKTFESLNLERAWNLLLTLLDAHGFVHVQLGVIHKIMLAKDGTNEPVPIYSSARGHSPDDLPDSQERVVYIYFLKNIRVETATSILNSILTERPQTIGDLDVLIIRDKSLNVKNAMKVIVELDLGGLRQAIKIKPLRYTEADTIARFINEELLGSKANNDRIRIVNQAKKSVHYFSPDVKVIPYRDKNSLIMLGQASEIDRIEHFIDLALDVEMEMAKSRVHIKDVKYHDPDQLQKIIQRLIKSPTGPQAQSNYFKDVIIVPESPKPAGRSGGSYASGNRLIIACNEEDWTRLEELIDRVDKPQPQVALEVMIVDASVAMDRELESHVRDTGYGVLGDNFSWRVNNYAGGGLDISSSSPDMRRENPLGINTGEGAVGSSWITFGNSPADPTADNGAWGFVRSLIKKDNSAIISQPFLVTNNNEECRFSSADKHRVEGEFRSSTNRTSRTRETLTADTSVTIVPRINAAGVVDLDIKLNVGEFTDRSDTTPVLTSRSLTTRATMSLGEVLVLGGIGKSNHRRTAHEVPLLGSIPIIGTFFSGKTKNVSKTNLYIFIRPSVIKPQLHSAPDDYTDLKLKYAKFQIGNVNNYAKSKDPIEHFFFKPQHATIKQAINDAKSNRFSFIDDFAERKNTPISADMIRDPYYHDSDSLKSDFDTKKLFASNGGGVPKSSMELNLKSRKKT